MAAIIETVPRLRDKGHSWKIRNCALRQHTDDAGRVVPWLCDVPYCPCCHGRVYRHRSRYAEALQRFPAGLQCQNITLTVRTVPAPTLWEELSKLSKAFRRMLRRNPFRGHVRAHAFKLEVTRAYNGMAHPHIHGQLWNRPVDQDELTYLWQVAAQLDYLPQVHVDDRTPADWLRYMSKPFQITPAMLKDPPFLISAVVGMEGFRAFEAGGLFRTSATN